jgi:hypothetical protein
MRPPLRWDSGEPIMAENNVIAEQPKPVTENYEIVHQKSPLFYPQYERKSDLKHQTHYCSGCGHGVAHKTDR